MLKTEKRFDRIQKEDLQMDFFFVGIYPIGWLESTGYLIDILFRIKTRLILLFTPNIFCYYYDIPTPENIIM